MMTQLMLLEEAHRQQAEQGGPQYPQTKIVGGGGQSPPHVLVPKNTFMDVFDTTCDSGNFRAPALRQLKNYLRSTMKQDRLNNCLLMHCHKSITDRLDTVQITRINEQHKGNFGKSE